MELNHLSTTAGDIIWLEEVCDACIGDTWCYKCEGKGKVMTESGLMLLDFTNSYRLKERKESVKEACTELYNKDTY